MNILYAYVQNNNEVQKPEGISENKYKKQCTCFKFLTESSVLWRIL